MQYSAIIWFVLIKPYLLWKIMAVFMLFMSVGKIETISWKYFVELFVNWKYNEKWKQIPYLWFGDLIK